MQLPAEGAEHLPGLLSVGRLAQYPAIALDHRVAAQDQPLVDAAGDVGRLLISQSDHHRGRALPVGQPGFNRFRRRTDLEPVARLGQQFPPPRRPAGQDQLGQRVRHIG